MIPPPLSQAPTQVPGFTPIPRTPIRAKLGHLLDEATIARAQAGDHVAFERVFQIYERAIHVYIEHIMGDHQDANDLTQDTFLKAFLALPQTRTDGPLNLTGWLYRIAHNVCLDELRHRKLVTWERFDAVFGPEQVTRARHRSLLVSLDRADDPSEVALLGDLSTEMRGALEQLPARYRTALELQHFHHLTYPELAAFFDITIPGIKGLLFRARNELRAIWAQRETREAST